MRYCKPCIHSISTVNADALCVDGSAANTNAVCTVGPQVGSECLSGTAATIAKCKVGTAALGTNPNCAGGTGVGTGCVTVTVNDTLPA